VSSFGRHEDALGRPTQSLARPIGKDSGAEYCLDLAGARGDKEQALKATYAYGGPERVRVTQIRSAIGQKPKVRGTLRALGLRRIGQSNILAVSPQLEGMLRRVPHLVLVEPLGRASATAGAAGVDDPDGVEEVEADDGLEIRFKSSKTERQLDRDLHSYAKRYEKSETVALFWDEGEGAVRESVYVPSQRPRRLSRTRLSFLRVELGEHLLVMADPGPARTTDEAVVVTVVADDVAKNALPELLGVLGAPDAPE
jgi:large subunit ribosomal protein L30